MATFTSGIFVVFVLIGASLTSQFYCFGYHLPSDRKEQTVDLTSYDIVKPYLVASREKRGAGTLSEEGHLREATFVVPVYGKSLTVDVHLNDGLLPPSHVSRSYAVDGGAVNKKPHPQHHCYYHGHVRNANKSSVAISTCNGIRGLINVEEESYYIEPVVDSEDEHLIYRPRDRHEKKSWVYGEDISHLDLQPKETAREGHLQRRRQKRDIETETKYVELVIVNDYQEYIRLGEDIASIEARCKEIANIMDMIYRQMNIRIALVGVVTWTQGDPFDVVSNPATTMAEFQRWRKENLIDDIKNDNAQFLTGVSFDGSTVGMASLGTMCSDERSGGVSQDHDTNVAVIASTMAHEMGHNLGIRHDMTEDNCQCDAPSNVGCVMEPSSGPIPPTNFSSCSFDHLSASLMSGLGACLFDYPDKIFDGPICGNGFQETGEECDCGTVEECNNDCCIAESCRLHENATCATGACCDNCSLKKAGEVCRAVRNECDLPEYCTGLSEECPANVYIQNGQKCADREDATCYNGRCLTLDGQCEDIWGEGARAGHELCYNFNTQGSSFGNCGGSASAFQPCARDHVKCGKLMCVDGNGYPVLSSLARASQGYVWDSNNNQHTCKSASIDLGQDVPDPGYVATGTLCKPGFVCSDFRCQNLSDLSIKPCPHGCYGNGVCNSKNHCHCNPHWNPPLCNTAGYGGSIDSGPARQTDQPITLYPKTPTLLTTHVTKRIIVQGGPNTSTVIVLLVMFLCVLPVLALIGFIVYWKKDILLEKLHKGPLKQKTTSRPYSNNKSSKPTSPSRPAPTRPAPSKPTIQHTHLQHRQDEPNYANLQYRNEKPSQGYQYSKADAGNIHVNPRDEDSNVFKYPSQVSAVPTRPSRPAPAAEKPREQPQVQRPSGALRPPAVTAKTTGGSVPQPQLKLPAAPVRPSPKPPVPQQKPNSPTRTSTVPPPPPKDDKPVTSNKPHFRLPPPIEDGAQKPKSTGIRERPKSIGEPPQRPARPALKPHLSNARDLGKPVLPPIKAKPNINRNNSKELDEQTAFASRTVPSDSKTDENKIPKDSSSSTAASTSASSSDNKPSVPKKPLPPQKPAVSNKPTVPTRPTVPSRPALKPPVKKDPVV